MESQKKFEEGVKSYGTRIADEIAILERNLPHLSDPNTAASGKKVIARYMRRSLNKLNSYFHNIEMLVEKEYAENAKRIDKSIEGTLTPRGEDLQKEST